MGLQSDHESGYFEGDDVGDEDELEIIHKVIQPENFHTEKGTVLRSTSIPELALIKL